MMADRYMRDQLISIIADRLDFERLRGFCDGQTDGLTDRRTFAIVESLSRLKITGYCRVLGRGHLFTFFLRKIGKKEGKLMKFSLLLIMLLTLEGSHIIYKNNEKNQTIEAECFMSEQF